MNRTLAVTLGLALTLTLAACGSNSSDSDSSPAPAASTVDSGATPDRDALIAELRADGEANGATPEQIECVVNALEPLDAAQLQSIKDGTPDADTLAVQTEASDECIPSDAASPEAS